LTDIDVAGWIDDILSECQCEKTPDGLIIRPEQSKATAKVDFAALRAVAQPWPERNDERLVRRRPRLPAAA
jgi:hypothetical protein